MEKFFFVGNVLEMLSRAEFLRKTVSVALYVISGIILLAGLAAFVENWRYISILHSPKILGGIFFQFLFIVGIYIIIHTIIVRRRTISGLPDSEFMVLSVCTVLARLAGEAYAGYAAAVSIGGGIFIWFAGSNVRAVLHKAAVLIPMFGDMSFTGGILFMLGGVFTAFFVLLGAYLLSELLSMVLDWRRSIRIQ